jgi:hypothetical protein
MSDIFISYASEDRAKAQTLAKSLENEGWSIFWDRTIPAGLTWDQYIGKELTEARCVLVLWSQASINSEWVREEADEGKTREILIPIRIEEVRPPVGFRGIQAVDLLAWDETQAAPEFRWAVSNISRVIGKPPREAEKQQRMRAEEQARNRPGEREPVEEETKRKANAPAVRFWRFWRFPLLVLLGQIVVGFIPFINAWKDFSDCSSLSNLPDVAVSFVFEGTVALIPALELANLGFNVLQGQEYLCAFAVYFGNAGWKFVTGLLLAFVITLSSAAALAYRRRGIVSGAEISSYWLGCTVALIPALGLVFFINAWNWVGGVGSPYDEGGGFVTGLLLAFVIALGSAVTLSYRRRELCRDRLLLARLHTGPNPFVGVSLLPQRLELARPIRLG